LVIAVIYGPLTCRILPARSAWCVVVAVVLTVACGSGNDRAGLADLSQQERDLALHTIVSWLECEECVDGELAAVSELRTAVVPPLINALEHGPSPANIAKERYALETRFGRLARDGVKLEASPDVIAEQYLNNYRARYGMRAAIALGDIGGADARNALVRASRDASVRPDVRQEVEKALAKLEAQSPPPSRFPTGRVIAILLGAGALFGGGWAFGTWRARKRRD